MSTKSTAKPLSSNLSFPKEEADEIASVIQTWSEKTTRNNFNFDEIDKNHPLYEKIVLTLVDMSYMNPHEIPEELKDSQDFWIRWITTQTIKGDAYETLLPFRGMPNNLKTNKEFANKLLTLNPFTFNHFDKSIKEDKEFIFFAVSNGNHSALLQSVDKDDHEFTLKCLEANWNVWPLLKAEQLKIPALFKEAFNEYPIRTLEHGLSKTMVSILVENKESLLNYAFQRSASTVFSFLEDKNNKQILDEMFAKLKNESAPYFEKCLLNLGKIKTLNRLFEEVNFHSSPVSNHQGSLVAFICSKISTEKLKDIYPELEQKAIKRLVDQEILRRMVSLVEFKGSEKKQKLNRTIKKR